MIEELIYYHNKIISNALQSVYPIVRQKNGGKNYIFFCNLAIKRRAKL